MGNIYTDGTYFKNNPTWDERDTKWKAGQIAKIIEKNGITPENICEVGCGAGQVLLNLQKLGSTNIRYDGFDISPQAIEKCKELENEKLHFKNIDILEHKRLTFDLLMAIDVFEHVEDYLGFLKQLKEHGEYYIFHIPLDISMQTIMRVTPLQNVRRQVGHLHYFTKETALETLKYCGYEIQDQFYTRWSLELPHRNNLSRFLYWPRKILFWFNEDFAVRLLGGFSLIVLAKRELG